MTMWRCLFSLCKPMRGWKYIVGGAYLGAQPATHQQVRASCQVHTARVTMVTDRSESRRRSASEPEDAVVPWTLAVNLGLQGTTGSERNNPPPCLLRSPRARHTAPSGRDCHFSAVRVASLTSPYTNKVCSANEQRWVETYHLIYSTGQTFWHTFSFNAFSLFSWLFTLWILTEGIKTMNEHMWNYVLNKKVWNNS